MGFTTTSGLNGDDTALGDAGLETVLAGFVAVAAEAGNAGGNADSGDICSESAHAGFSVFSAADGLEAGDLSAACFVSVHAGFSGLSLETADTGEAAFAIKEAAKTAPAVSSAERLKLIFSPKAE